MAYTRADYQAALEFTRAVFTAHGLAQKDADTVADVLLCADLFGIESHGVQRLIRYHASLKAGEVKLNPAITLVRDTPVSAVVDAGGALGHVAGVHAMEMAIAKAQKTGVGMVAVRNSTHYGIAGYYPMLAMEKGYMGICMTNSESLAVPTFGRQIMLGTNPIALCMPAQPVPFWFDAATTVAPMGKMEVYSKKSQPLPGGWALDENGEETRDAQGVIDNVRGGRDGGLLPLGGMGEENGGHKGYGLGIMVDIFTGILSGGSTSMHMKQADGEHTAHFFAAVDLELFGDRETIVAQASQMLQELRQSRRAAGQPRIYTHGEKEWENRRRCLREGIAIQDATLAQFAAIARETGLDYKKYFGRAGAQG